LEWKKEALIASKKEAFLRHGKETIGGCKPGKERSMSKYEKELEKFVEQYRKLAPENKKLVLSNVHLILATQESTLKSVAGNPATKKRARQIA
jgi:hypothetical protein